jgi:hypothetical protein
MLKSLTGYKITITMTATTKTNFSNITLLMEAVSNSDM